MPYGIFQPSTSRRLTCEEIRGLILGDSSCVQTLKHPWFFPFFCEKNCWNLLNSCLTTGEISCKLIWSIHLIENTCFPLDLPKISQSVELRKSFLAIKLFVAFLGLRLLAPSFVNAPHTPNSSSTRVAMRAEGEKEGEVSWKRRWS